MTLYDAAEAPMTVSSLTTAVYVGAVLGGALQHAGIELPASRYRFGAFFGNEKECFQ